MPLRLCVYAPSEEKYFKDVALTIVSYCATERRNLYRTKSLHLWIIFFYDNDNDDDDDDDDEDDDNDDASTSRSPSKRQAYAMLPYQEVNGLGVEAEEICRETSYLRLSLKLQSEVAHQITLLVILYKRI